MALNINYEEEVLKILRTLDDTEKQQVLDYVRVMNRPKSVGGKDFIERTKHIRISDTDAEEMMQAISEAFNQVDPIEVDLDE